MFTLDSYKVSSATSRSIHTSPTTILECNNIFNHKKIIIDVDEEEGDEDINLSKMLNCKLNALNSVDGRDTKFTIQGRSVECS